MGSIVPNDYVHVQFLFVFSAALCQTPWLQNGAYRGLGTFTKSLYETGESIVPLCDENYHLSISGALSDISRTCQAGNSWDGPNLACIRKFKQLNSIYI